MVANNGDGANAVDDLTPTAFEEATVQVLDYTLRTSVQVWTDQLTHNAYQTSRYLRNRNFSEILVRTQDLDGTTNNEKGASGISYTRILAESINVGIPLEGLTVNW